MLCFSFENVREYASARRLNKHCSNSDLQIERTQRGAMLNLHHRWPAGTWAGEGLSPGVPGMVYLAWGNCVLTRGTTIMLTLLSSWWTLIWI